MTSLALNAISAFLSSDIPANGNSSVIPGNASHATVTGANSQPLSNESFSFLPFSSLFLTLVMKNQDMLKLVVIGGLFETFRRFTYRAWDWILNEWFIIAQFQNTDDTYSMFHRRSRCCC